jgi:hypothetical protein
MWRLPICLSPSPNMHLPNEPGAVVGLGATRRIRPDPRPNKTKPIWLQVK